MKLLLTFTAFGITAALTGCGAPGSYQDGYGNSSSAPVAPAVKKSGLPGPLSLVNSDIGKVLAGKPDNKTLYTFGKDTSDVSVCYDACAAAWPPFLVADPTKATNELTITGRKDGALQWVLNGQPLYFWAGDVAEGDTSGAAIPNWSVATLAN